MRFPSIAVPQSVQQLLAKKSAAWPAVLALKGGVEHGELGKGRGLNPRRNRFKFHNYPTP